MVAVYCLKCLGPVRRDDRSCASCGHRNDPRERRVYWNRAPGIVRVERIAKALACIVAALLVVPLMAVSLPYRSTASGWLLVTPGLLALALWRTAATLTRRSRYFGPAVFWTALFGLYGATLFFAGFTMAASTCVLAIAVISAAASGFASWKARLIRRWRSPRSARDRPAV